MNENLTAIQPVNIPTEAPVAIPLKVLVIEDNPLDARLIQIMLHEAGSGQFDRKRTSDQLAHYAEELRERNTQMEADYNMAREIQQVFLPQQYPTFPRTAAPAQSALRFFHRYLPAAAVGGDFFNVFAITDTIA